MRRSAQFVVSNKYNDHSSEFKRLWRFLNFLKTLLRRLALDFRLRMEFNLYGRASQIYMYSVHIFVAHIRNKKVYANKELKKKTTAELSIGDPAELILGTVSPIE